MDITPQLPAGHNLIQAYGDGGFAIGERRYTGSVMVFADRVVPWPVAAIGDITADSLSEAVTQTPKVEILLVGCGVRLLPVQPGLRESLRSAGIAADFMDTGAACRTFNVLLGEDRRVAAALIAVG